MSANTRHDFRCLRCGARACYGEGVYLLKGESGRWYCREHVPKGFLPGSRSIAANHPEFTKSAPPPAPPLPQQGLLL